MKKIILLLLISSFNCFAQESQKENISFSKVISACKQGTDSICNGVNGMKKNLEIMANNHISKDLVVPALTVFNILNEKEIKLKKTLIDNDQIIIQPKKMEYRISFSF